MRKVLLPLSIIYFLCISFKAHAEEKIKIAVMDLKGDDASQKTVSYISNILEKELANINIFYLIEKNQIETVKKEKLPSETQCFDKLCAVKIGRLLLANKTLIGSVTMVDNKTAITINIIDIDSGTEETTITEKGITEDMLAAVIHRISQKLEEKYDRSHKENQSVKRSLKGYYLRGIVPGWGQWYIGEPVKGSIFFSGFLIAGISVIITTIDFYREKKEYRRLPNNAEIDQFDSKYHDYRNASNRTNICRGILFAVYLLNWVDIIFFNHPDKRIAIEDSNVKLGRNIFQVSLNYSQGLNREQILNFSTGTFF